MIELIVNSVFVFYFSVVVFVVKFSVLHSVFKLSLIHISTVNVGIGLAREGKKVLLIDADPQGSLTASLGYEEPDDLRITLATIMMDVINEEEISLEDGILHHQENVDLLPANIELSALEVTMGNVMSREMIMKEYIDAIRGRYDYILIDCMPSLGMMTINALVSSDSVLIPVQAASV